MRKIFLMVAAVLLSVASCTHPHPQTAQLAAQGYAPAQYEYGRRLLTGQNGEKRNPELAYAWLRAAAEQDYWPAQQVLALCYQRGLGTPADPVQAERWYEKAAAHGSPDAAFALLQMAAEKNDLPAMQRQLTRLADQGVRPAQSMLGKLLLCGLLGKGQEARAVRYLRFAAMQQDGEACLLMALCYASGRGGLPQDPALAEGWLRNAADCGNEAAKKMVEEG